jgi:hypothetical protein
MRSIFAQTNLLISLAAGFPLDEYRAVFPVTVTSPVGGELVVAGSDAAEVLQFREEALDQVALAVEALAEAGFPAPIALGRDVGVAP